VKVGQKGTEQVIESNLRLDEQTAPHKSVPAVKELTEDSSQREESYIANWVAY
jgi:malate/lactate dehydrogenase